MNSDQFAVWRRPLYYGAKGAYRITMRSGTMAAGLAGGATVWSMHNNAAAATGVVVVPQISIGAGGLVAFTAGLFSFDLFIARAYTSLDTGGTAATLTTNNGKMRTSMATIAMVDDLRISSTAALTPGVRTLDAQPIASVRGSITATAGEEITIGTEQFGPLDDHPIVLAEDEGLVMQATVPATGTWHLAVNLCFFEVQSYLV